MPGSVDTGIQAHCFSLPFGCSDLFCDRIYEGRLFPKLLAPICELGKWAVRKLSAIQVWLCRFNILELVLIRRGCWWRAGQCDCSSHLGLASFLYRAPSVSVILQQGVQPQAEIKASIYLYDESFQCQLLCGPSGTSSTAERHPLWVQLVSPGLGVRHWQK